MSSSRDITLINTCSYPSQEPNSDPSDCVFTPGNAVTSTVTLVKNTAGDPDTNIADDSSVPIGTVAYDTAALLNTTDSPTGTVTYYVELGDASCSIAGATSLGAKTVGAGGAVPNSDTITLTAPGTYEFWAVYSGGPGNNGSTSTCGSETVTAFESPALLDRQDGHRRGRRYDRSVQRRRRRRRDQLLDRGDQHGQHDADRRVGVGSADRQPRLRPGTAGNQTTGFTLALGGDADLHRARYTVTQADIDNNGGGDGDIDNTATADSDQTDPVTDSAAVPLAPSPALSIEKTVTGVDADTTRAVPGRRGRRRDLLLDPGDQHGQQTLTGVSVSDPRIANLDCDPAPPATRPPASRWRGWRR